VKSRETEGVFVWEEYSEEGKGKTLNEERKCCRERTVKETGQVRGMRNNQG